MKKVVINLSPQKINNSKLSLKKVVVFIPLMAIIAVVGLVAVLLLNVVVLKKAHTYSGKSSHWEKWGGKAKILQEVKKEIADLKNKKVKLAQALSPRYLISSILGDVFASLPKNIWFDSFNFVDESLDIQGYVVKWNKDYLESLDEFIRSLRSKKYFSSKFANIQIKKSQRDNFNGIEVLRFDIQCKK